MFFHRLAKIHAPEFSSGLTWLNGEPQTLRASSGRPVLIDFWTYSCVNCQRSLPAIQVLYARYAAFGLTVIGVHTPEFAFEKDVANVQRAVKAAGITYPVVLDNEYEIWNLYANRAWPHSYLMNAEGIIVYDHVGEGGDTETETAVQKALMESGVTDLPHITPVVSKYGGVCYRTSPETYLGYLRGRFGNTEEFLPDAEEAFTDRGIHSDDIPYLHGHWRVAGEYVEHLKTLAAATEYVLFKYSAFGANAVIASPTGKATIEVLLDGLPLSDDMLGPDVRRQKDGTSVAIVTEARLYRLTKSAAYHRGTLTLKVKTSGIRLYAFTFEGCA